MTPETVDIAAELYSVAKWAGGGLAALVVWFLKREVAAVTTGLASKADKEHMQREIEDLKMELKETRDRRDGDLDRIERANAERFVAFERANAERFAAFSESMRDRLTIMERNVGTQLDMVSSAMSDKLDSVMEVMRQLRKE